MSYVFGNIDINLARELLKKTQSIIWSGLIELKGNYATRYGNDEQKIEELFNSTINTLFIEQGLKTDNVEYFCALHTNTDIPHIHFLYWEKEPLITYTKLLEDEKWSKFMVPKKAINDFKKAIVNFSQIYKKEEIYISVKDVDGIGKS